MWSDRDINAHHSPMVWSFEYVKEKGKKGMRGLKHAKRTVRPGSHEAVLVVSGHH